MAQTLFQPASGVSTRQLIVRRLAMLVALYLMALAVLLADREGLRDSTKAAGEQISLLDVIYFTAVTLSTTGYGDIVPVTPQARAIDLLLLTPVRMLVWLVFVGTTVQVTYSQLREDYAMEKLKGRLAGHVIVCGFGTTGQSTAEELLAIGHPAESVVVVDHREEACSSAAEAGFFAVCGDATREAVLEKVGVRQAKDLMAATGRDDTNVLICLTARSMHAGLRMAAAVKLSENTKLLKASGAATTVVPAVAGGRLLAASTRHPGLVELLEDLTSSGGTMTLGQRRASPSEAGLPTGAVPGSIVIGIARGGRRLSLDEVRGAVIEPDDVLTLVEGAAAGSPAPHAAPL